MRVLGEIQRTEVPGDWPDDFAIVFGGETFDDFKRGMGQYPRNAVAALTDRPVKYCRVDFGNPAGAKKAYLDVYRNFRFFVFNGRNDIRWYQSNKGRAAFFRLSTGRTPADMFAQLRSGATGNNFLGFFYGRVRAETRSGNVSMLWPTAGKAVAAKPDEEKTNTAPRVRPSARPSTPRARRKYIEGVILKRL